MQDMRAIIGNQHHSGVTAHEGTQPRIARKSGEDSVKGRVR